MRNWVDDHPRSSPDEGDLDGYNRFPFGKNWRDFIERLDEIRIAEATGSLAAMLGKTSLAGCRFLDVGCGSGVFSLGAMRLGAACVHSFDYDPISVACAEVLRAKFFPNSPRWVIEQGSAVDEQYLSHLGKWDVVYSWGVLHHPGAMWRAMQHVAAA